MSGVAIIGIGCRFPGGVSDPESYWNLLCEGRSVISDIPDDRWSLEGFFDPEPDKPNRSYSRWGGFLDDVSEFDPDFFGLSIRETEAMDPQQRLLLITAVEAIQDAGLRQSELRQDETGVFVGASNIDYNLLARQRTGHGDIQAGTGTAFSILANRVSHQLDLKGPSLTVDTACSSSMVALDIACEKLLSGACDAALSGGVNILLDPRMFITFSRARMFSPCGKIRAFDAGAYGFVRGEGAASVLLKRESDALRDENRIYAVIRATAINQDGATSTITAPNEAAQSRLFRKAVALAGIDPSDVNFVEAHGTGTALGDPVEARAAGRIMGGASRRKPLLIGSVKSSIGHLEPAAGIAGLIKAALSLHKGAVPPSAQFETPNPAIPFDELNIQVPQAVIPLADRGANGYALVNSSGFGG
ncbi:MAG: beta-ketoacyl synthase N-terminal-like domain-containing protein, partial [Methyloligellaceae bacterium]